MPVTTEYMEVRLRSLTRSDVEIMVLGYGDNHRMDLGNTPPEPEGGLPALEAYVKANKQPVDEGISGKVAFKVSVNEHGQVTEMELEKGLCDSCDMEAERLLKDWEAGWIPAYNRGRPIKSLFRVKLKFP